MQVNVNDIMEVLQGYLDRVLPIDRILTVMTTSREQGLMSNGHCSHFEQVFDLLILPCRPVFCQNRDTIAQWIQYCG